jgi:biotin synthase
MIGRVRRLSAVPISALVSATTLDVERLYRIQAEGADIVGVGMDGASRAVFEQTRGKKARGPHDWDYHWYIVREARRIFGPMKVNCHIVVGLGETDQDLIDLFYQAKEEQIAVYLFSFNPEPGTAMQHVPRAPLHRWRRIQLTKYLIENANLERRLIEFDATGNLVRIEAPDMMIEVAIDSGLPFMTNGCPDKHGNVACNRPYGSYRPGEEFRDYPFLPMADDVRCIRQQMRLEDVWHARGGSV